MLRQIITSRTITTGSKVLTLPRLPIFEALDSHPKSKTAIVHSRSGRAFTYGDLLAATARTKDWILMRNGAEQGQDLKEKRIAFLVENGYDYVGTHPNTFSSLVSTLDMFK